MSSAHGKHRWRNNTQLWDPHLSACQCPVTSRLFHDLGFRRLCWIPLPWWESHSSTSSFAAIHLPYFPSLPMCTAILAQISVTSWAMGRLQLREAVPVIGLCVQVGVGRAKIKRVWKLKEKWDEIALGQRSGKGYKCPIMNGRQDQGKGKQKNMEKEH